LTKLNIFKNLQKSTKCYTISNISHFCKSLQYFTGLYKKNSTNLHNTLHNFTQFYTTSQHSTKPYKTWQNIYKLYTTSQTFTQPHIQLYTTLHNLNKHNNLQKLDKTFTNYTQLHKPLHKCIQLYTTLHNLNKHKNLQQFARLDIKKTQFYKQNDTKLFFTTFYKTQVYTTLQHSTQVYKQAINIFRTFQNFTTLCSPLHNFTKLYISSQNFTNKNYTTLPNLTQIQTLHNYIQVYTTLTTCFEHLCQTLHTCKIIYLFFFTIVTQLYTTLQHAIKVHNILQNYTKLFNTLQISTKFYTTLQTFTILLQNNNTQLGKTTSTHLTKQLYKILEILKIYIKLYKTIHNCTAFYNNSAKIDTTSQHSTQPLHNFTKPYTNP
jgi:hypothetical protein